MVVFTMGIVYWIGWPLSGPPHASRSAALQTSSTFADPVPSARPGTTGATTGLTGAPHVSVGRLVDLNRANAGDLQALPGIGAVLAQRVIAFRQSVGGFRSIDELRGVKGIGAKKLDRLKPLVTVSAADQMNMTERRVL